MSGKNKLDNTVLSLNNAIMAIDVNRFTEIPKIHIGMNPFLTAMRVELYYMNKQVVQTRREKLRKLLIEDFLQEDKELRQVGLAYINELN